MTLLSEIGKTARFGEIVISDSDLGMSAHRELFSFKDDVYFKLDSHSLSLSIRQLIEEINDSLNPNILKIHFVFGWQNLLQIAMWRFDSYSREDISSLLSSAGMNLESKEKVHSIVIQELFNNLFKKGSFYTFRKICHLAKEQIDRRIQNKSIQTFVHLVAPEAKRIIASSL